LVIIAWGIVIKTFTLAIPVIAREIVIKTFKFVILAWAIVINTFK